MDKIRPLSEVRSNLSGIVSRMRSDRRRLVVTVHGKPAAVIVSPEEIETLEITADAELLDSLRRALEDVRAGRLVRHKELFRAKRTPVR
jgi:prevent-host-death family protein